MKLEVFCSNPRSSGLPIEILFSCRASNGLPFVRRPWKTVKIGYLYCNSISKHFHKTFHRFQKARKIWEINISLSEIKFFFPQIHGLPGFPLKSFVSCRASKGLPFVRRPWKTVKIGYLYSNSISKHFRKTFYMFQKGRKYGTKISRKVK